MSAETRPGDLPRYDKYRAPVTLGDLLKIGGFVLGLCGAGGTAAYVELKRNTDKVETIQTDLREVRVTQQQQQSQLTSISQDQAVQTYRLGQLEKVR